MASSLQTLDNIFSDVRTIAGKDSTTLTDAVLLRFANKYYLQLVRELIGLNEDLYAEISDSSLVADQREYVLPIDDTASAYGGGLIKLQRVEINYTDANSSTWKVASPMSLQEIDGPTVLDSDIANQYDKSAPKYWFKDRSVWIAPVPDVAVTNGLRIYWIERPDELEVTTDIPDFPKDFLIVLEEGILTDVYRMFNRTADARDAKENYLIGVSRMRELEQNIDQEQVYRMKTIRKRYD
jgi:hypothetical protein